MSQTSLLELYVHFILIWVMVDIWVLFINNFAYRTLRMNENSSYDTLIVALFVTSCSLVIIGSGLSFIDAPESSKIPHLYIGADETGSFSPQSRDDEIKEAEKLAYPNTGEKIDPQKDFRELNVEDYFVSTIKKKSKRKERSDTHAKSFKLDTTDRSSRRKIKRIQS